MEKLYLSDLDKTLLRSDLSISGYTAGIWNEVVKRGGRLSVATARSYTGVKKLLEKLDLEEPLILLDGVMIVSPDGEIVHVEALGRQEAAEIMNVCSNLTGSNPLLVGLEDDGGESFVYPRSPNEYQKELLRSFHNDRRVLDADSYGPMDRNLKMVYMEDEETTALLERELKALFSDTIEIKRSADPYIDCWFMTVMHKGGDKAHALRRLEEMEGVEMKHTTVFGDSHNDIGLFEAAGRRVAVANAIEEIKSIADVVLPHTNDEDAVAKFLADEFDIARSAPQVP